MSPGLLILTISIYFLMLVIVSWITGRNASSYSFFLGNRQSPWYIVAIGMIGASISGVTFISIPGEVGASNFSYLQIVLGYLLGYFVIANVLMPLYYRLNLASIYVYLKQRFGMTSYRTGAFFFLVSRVIGSSFRLYLVAMVLDKFVFSNWGVPFWSTVAITIIFIWIYSFRGGVKTIIWTDTLQTFFFLTAVIFTIWYIAKQLNFSFGDLLESIESSRYSQIFVWDWKLRNNFFKHFISGAFIAIVMTGLDQDMMQKNLSCRNIREAKKNMYWMSTSLVFVNLLFLSLGALLYIFAHSENLIVENFSNPDASCRIGLLNEMTSLYDCHPTDQLFPFLALTHLPVIVGIVFILGLVAAAYSSADSALTALTTSFCVDFLGFSENDSRIKLRYIVHIGFSLLLFVVIILFKLINNDSVINSVFTMAGYTYGPLLGFYTFGLFTRRKVRDRWVPLIAVLSPAICYVISSHSQQWFGGYTFGFELLILNGALTFLGMTFLQRQNKSESLK
ncbi:MAG TPA: sodium:solute symporter [Bacteroidales bacterium]|nr:sodium:solute symporter [Bacteroidales bacterium]